MSSIQGVNGYVQDAYSVYAKTQKPVSDKSKEVKNETGVVYEPSENGKQVAQSVDRSAIIAQMKADVEARTEQMRSLVVKLMGGQGQAIAKTDDMWKFLASGKFEVDPATKAQAEKDIAEDGYWGVEQTSQRIFDFAKALSGGDPATMEKMRKAFEKGFKQATQTWGKELPEISQKTYAATQKLFDDYATSFQTEA